MREQLLFPMNPAVLFIDPCRREGLLPRRDALSRVVAAKARAVEDVQHFRRDVLGDALLTHGDMPEWLGKRLNQDRKSRRDSRTAPSDHLSYIAPTPDVAARSVPVFSGGVLAHLKAVSVSLGDRFLWHEAQAVVFVVTDLVPRINAVQVGIDRIADYPGLARISLELDPSLRPSEVAKIYAAAKRQIVNKQRERALTDKVLELAAFAAENLAGRTYKELQTMWNSTHRRRPHLQYRGNVRSFSVICNRAIDKLLMTSKRTDD